MIRFEQVSFQYEGEDAQGCLNQFDLKVNKGECVLLCGPSGCGKTTILRLVNGLIPHFYEGNIDGCVLVDGKQVSQQELYDTARQVGTVFQNPRSQFFNVDTTSELAFGCENAGLPEEEIWSRIEQTMQKAHMDHLMNRNIFKLSGGEKQKIACGCVMTAAPNVILLDEPSANLDYDAMKDLRMMIHLWREEGKTILIAEHRLAYCLEYVDRVIVMDKGRISQDMPREQFRKLKEEELQEMGLRTLIQQDARQYTIHSRDREEMVLSNLRFAYKKDAPILDIDQMYIPVGEIVAVVGANGVGKSTFLRCLCGMERRCKGNLTYKGRQYSGKERLKLMYLVMQDVNHQLFTESVLEEVLISMSEEDEATAREILSKLGLTDCVERHPVSLSGGQKQRVAVASAIASNRDIILFDEPTSGLDYEHMKRVSWMFQQLKEAGKTVIVVTHDDELVKECCTCVIHFGKEISCRNF